MEKGAYCCLTAWRAGHSKIMCNSSATATLPQCLQTLYIGSVNMLSPSKTPENNWQLMRAQPKLEKPLRAPTRNRQLTMMCSGTKGCQSINEHSCSSVNTWFDLGHVRPGTAYRNPYECRLGVMPQKTTSRAASAMFSSEAIPQSEWQSC